MGIRQMQNLLQYLGYYEGEIDGIWGNLSTQATMDFQKDNGLDQTGVFDERTEEVIKTAVFHSKFKGTEVTEVTEVTDDHWGNIKYFRKAEFACKCGKCGGFPVDVDHQLVELLDVARDHFGVPIYINSGIRCKTHNKAVGGASQSRHCLYGDAADIAVSGIAPRTVYNFFETLLPNSGGLGLYNWGIHVDTRPNKARWNG